MYRLVYSLELVFFVSFSFFDNYRYERVGRGFHYLTKDWHVYFDPCPSLLRSLSIVCTILHFFFLSGQLNTVGSAQITITFAITIIITQATYALHKLATFN